MTDTTRAAWDGRPENPERDGWYWVRPNLAPAYEPECWQWCAAAEAFARDASDLNDPWFPQCYDYLGPALLPAQVAAAVAAERADFLRLLDLHRWLRTPAPSNPEAYDAWVEDNASAGEEAAKLEAAIRARGPGSALADALRHAEARGMREAAEIVRCGCVHAEQVADITDKHGANSAMRWRACAETNCGALEAAAILAAADAKEKPDAE